MLNIYNGAFRFLLIAFFLSPDSSPIKRMIPRSSKTRAAKAQVTLATPTKRKRMRNARQSQPPNSDIESIKTEDFENQFQSMVVKQVANVPITTFDRFIVDSDLDTITSQAIRDKFLSALSKLLLKWIALSN